MSSTCLSCIGSSFIFFSFFFISSLFTHTTTHTFSLLPLFSLLSRPNRYAEYLLLLLPLSLIFLFVSAAHPISRERKFTHVFSKSINLRSVRVRVGGFHFSLVSTFNSLLPLPLFYGVIFLGNIIILSPSSGQLLTEE